MKRLIVFALFTSVSLCGQVAKDGRHKIMIFGGVDHRTYLGCLSCSAIARDSVSNEIGKYGSEISETSILNHISPYGSEIEDTSACNEIAEHPPIIVNEVGGSYGYLTLNEIHDQVRNEKVLTWLKGVCKQ